MPHLASAILADNTIANMWCSVSYNELQLIRAAAESKTEAARKQAENALNVVEDNYKRNCMDVGAVVAGADIFEGDLMNRLTTEWLATHLGGDIGVGRKNADIMLATGNGFDGGTRGWGDFLESLHADASSDGDDSTTASFARLYDRLAAGNYVDEYKITAPWPLRADLALAPSTGC